MSDLPLAAEFPPATRDDWMKAVEGVLKGKPFDKTLVTRTADGMAIQPVYPRRAGADAVAGRAAGEPWGIVMRADHPDPAQANRLALADLEGGATGLALVMAGSASARGFGLAGAPAAAFAGVLDGVMADLITLRLESAPFQGIATARALRAELARRGFKPEQLQVDFGLDPLSDMARTGMNDPDWQKNLGAEAKAIVGEGYSAPFLRADGRPFHEAGASEAEELALTLASLVAMLRALDAAGLPPAKAAPLMTALLTAEADQFLTMAKLRAFRRLWDRVQTACGIAAQPLALHAETGWRMMTRRDPWVNMLRSTIAAFAAGTAGAQSVTVLPFTQALGLADDFARRAARNTSLVLIYESNLHRVADPAAGAGGLGTLTDELAAAAWKRFQAIEAEGGLAASLTKGTVQAMLATSRAARDKALASRREPITGVSEFPDIGEAPVTTLDVAPPAAPALPAGTPAFAPLPSHRLAEGFEALRDRADALTAKGRQPSVFLANLGTIADFTARATFAKNAFEAGGIRALTNDGFADDAALIAAFKASGAPFACICGTDALYGEKAAEIAKKLHDSGVVRLFLAGRPGDMEEVLRSAGVHQFVFVGADILALLRGAHDALT